MRVQGVVHVPKNGGRRTPSQLFKHLNYLCRKGTLPIRIVTHDGEIEVPYENLREMCETLIVQSGRYCPGQSEDESKQELSTHSIVSFSPPPSEMDEATATLYKSAAEVIGRDWAAELFRSGLYGGRWWYLPFPHFDRPHPHVHVTVLRVSPPDPITRETTLLRISHMNEHINWDTLNQVLEMVCRRRNEQWAIEGDPRSNLIEVDASTRAERGVPGRSLTTAEYREQMRERARRQTNQRGGEAVGNYLRATENAEFNFAAPAGTPFNDDAMQLDQARDQEERTPRGEGDNNHSRAAVSPSLADDQSAIDAQLRREAEQHRRRQFEEDRARREAEEQNREPARRLPRNSSVDAQLRDEAEQYRKRQIEEDRTRREAEDSGRSHAAHDRQQRRKRASGAARNYLEATENAEFTFIAPTDMFSRADGAQRGQGRVEGERSHGEPQEHGNEPNLRTHRMETRGERIRRKRREGEERRRGKDRDPVERIVETRAQKHKREREEARQASAHAMELRNTSARQARQQSQQGGAGAAGGGGGGGGMDASEVSAHAMKLRNTPARQARQESQQGGGGSGGMDASRVEEGRTRPDRTRDRNPRTRP